MSPETVNLDLNLELNRDERECLSRYLRDDQQQQPALATLARLEKLGLLMSGWGQQYVVTERGREVLARLQ